MPARDRTPLGVARKGFSSPHRIHENLNSELSERGELVAAVGLTPPDQAKLVRAGKDGLPVTDGVFPESKEFLAGYWIVDVESPHSEPMRLQGARPLRPAPAVRR